MFAEATKSTEFVHFQFSLLLWGFVLTLSCNNGDGGNGLAVVAVPRVSHNLHVLIRGLVLDTGIEPVLSA